MHDAMNSIGATIMGSIPQESAGPLPEFLLMRETHHRLMNSFALIAAYLRMEADGSSGALPSKAVVRLTEMIRAQSELHRCLALRQTDEMIALDDYMIQLCRCLSAAVLRPFGVTCEVATDAGYLPAWQCERLGLATTELVLNAVKHAFGQRSSGKISITLRRQGDKWRCVIADNGCCFDPSGDTGQATPSK